MPQYPVQIGDPAPWFSASSGSGPEPVAFDELAGRVILLFFFGAAAQPDVATTLSSLDPSSEIFDGDRFLFLGVSHDPDDFAQERVPNQIGHIYLLDASDDAARRYGVGATSTSVFRPTAFLLSPALQILDIIPFDKPEDFVRRSASALRALLTRYPSEQNVPMIVAPNVFDLGFCRQLIDLYDAAGGRELGAIEKNGKIVERFDQQLRKRLDYYVADEAVIARCRELISRRLLPLVYRAFQFKVTRIERYLIGCYDATTGGYFRPHRDNTAPIVAHRRFAVSIILNDDFDGGALAFPEFGRKTYRTAPGDAIVFSCALLHEVTTVTRGRRYAFISFLYDEASQRMREEFMRSTAGAAQGGRP
jgi:peroxiredoxin